MAAGCFMCSGVYNYFNIFILHFNYSISRCVCVSHTVTNVKELQLRLRNYCLAMILCWLYFVIVLRDIYYSIQDWR